MNQTQYLTIKEVTAFLKVRESWIRNKIFKREIPFTRIGRQIRFKRLELENWINDQNNGEQR